MEHTLELRIRQRAYEIWHAHGQADGKADEYWLAAEREILSTLNAAASKTSLPAKSRKRAQTGSATGRRAMRSSKTKS